MVGFGVVWLLGLGLVVLDAAPGWKAFGLGLLLPGGGFLYTSDPIFVALTLVLFAIAFVAWFGAGNILAPPIVWVGAAGLAVLRVHTGVWEWTEWFVPGLLGGMLVLGLIGQRVTFRAARQRGRDRNGYLAALAAAPARPAATRPEIAESSAEDLAAARSTLDLALQPVDEFEGYDWIDQFQTSAVRYQLNFQHYALALMHANRTPAFTGYLAQAQRNLIEKMTNRRVWGFWKWENLWGNLDANPDPIRRDDIMVSGYLGVMLGAYESNTRDQRLRRARVVDLPVEPATRVRVRLPQHRGGGTSQLRQVTVRHVPLRTELDLLGLQHLRDEHAAAARPSARLDLRAGGGREVPALDRCRVPHCRRTDHRDPLESAGPDDPDAHLDDGRRGDGVVPESEHARHRPAYVDVGAHGVRHDQRRRDAAPRAPRLGQARRRQLPPLRRVAARDRDGRGP